MSDSKSLLARHRKVMPDWIALYYDEPVALDHGEGLRVWDVDGNEYLDFFGGILTTASGHALPEVVEAVKAQADKMLHSSTAYLIEPQIELAERLAELSTIPDAKVFFCNSGTEANETAMLISSTYRRSSQILALRNSYHGRSFATVAVTGNRGWSPSANSPLNVSYVHSGYKYRSPFGHLPDDQFIKACADDLRNVLETTTSGDVACMIAEPIQGVGGFATPPDGFFGAMKEVLDEYGILFISDEVQTAWGRTGDHYWGFQAHDITPDIITFAKGIGNGLAIAGVIARGEIMDSINANSISTFGGNPLSTAGALANLNFMLDNDLQTNAKKIGEHMFGRLREYQESSAIVGDVRGKGLMMGIELVEPGGTKPAPALAGKVMEETKKRSLLIGKGGLYGNTLRVSPPMTISMEQADDGCTRLIESLEAIS